MKMIQNNLLITALVFICILISQNSTLLANDRAVDLYTVPVPEGKYRYYSSPEDSAYIKTLPEGYVHINTTMSETLEPMSSEVGQIVNLETSEPLELSDFLTLPQGSVITGKITRIETPIRLIRDSKVRIDFEKVTTPGGYEFILSNKTFEVMPLIFRKGSRYSFVNEIVYSSLISGAKYPVGRFLNVPVSYAIGAGAGLVGGIVYGALEGDMPKNTGYGTMRGLGAKSIFNIFFLSNKTFTVNQNTPVLLTVNKSHVEDLRYKPEYLNIQQLIMASSLSGKDEVNNELISKTSNNNSNVSEVINFYEKTTNNNPNIDNKINLGRTYLNSGRFQIAINHFQQLLNESNTDARIYYYLAQSLENAGKLSEARLNYDLAIENNIKNKEVYLKMANLLKKMGNSTEAAIYFDKYNKESLALN